MSNTIIKKHTYPDYWLETDMDNMGTLFEYCDFMCEKYYGKTNFNRLKFLNDFMKSQIRKEMEDGHPRYLSQAAYDSFIKFMVAEKNNNVDIYINKKPIQENYAYFQMYWVGWAYAYIHYQADIPFEDLVKKVPIRKMIGFYKLGHEIDIDAFYNKMKWMLEE